MNRKTVLFCVRRAGTTAAILGPVILVTAAVGFVVQVEQGIHPDTALRFVGFVLLWSFLVAWCAVTIASLLVLHRRLKTAGISLAHFAELPKAERKRFRKARGS